MPREYPASKQPPDLVHAESAWAYQGSKGHEQFYYEVRETREFTIADVQEQLAVIYGLRPEDFGKIEIKQESSGGTLEKAELYLKPELSQELFGYQVSFEFIVEGRLNKRDQARVTSLNRVDYYDDEDIRGEELADYRRDLDGGRWVVQPDIKATKRPAH